MAKFTKSTEKKGAAAAVEKKVGAAAGNGAVAKKAQKKQQKPAVAPAAVKAAVAEVKSAAAVAPKKAVAPKTKEAKAEKKPGFSVFIGNLPPTIKRKAILSLFKPFGVPASIRFRRNNGSKLFKADFATVPSIIGFVDLATAADARSAASALNGHKIGEHVLRVDVQAGSKNAGKTDAKRTAFVGNLAFNTTDAQVRKAFEVAGKVEYVRLNQNRKGCDGTAFVCYKEASSVAAALKLTGTEVNGRAVRIHRSEQKQKAVAAAKPVKEEVEEEDDEEEADFEDAAEDDDSEEEEVAAPVVVAKKAAKAGKAAVAPKAAANKKKGGKKASA